MDKQEYIVTELAGPHVAGQSVVAGDTLSLTPDEALTEALAGTIRLRKPDAPVAEPEPAPAEVAPVEPTTASELDQAEPVPGPAEPDQIKPRSKRALKGI